MANLRRNKFDPQTDHVRDNDDRQHFQQTEPKTRPERSVTRADGPEMLQSGIVHAEKQSRHQRHDDDDHHSLQVDAVADMAAAAGYVIRYEQERLESIERRMKFFELAALFEVRLDLIYKIS